MDYIWAKFKQNRFLTCGQLLFDFCGHPLLRSSVDIPEGEDYKILSIFIQTNAYLTKIFVWVFLADRKL